MNLLRRRDLDQGLRVGEKCAVAADGQRHEDAAVFRHTIGDQCRVQRFLRAIDPGQHPAQVADGEGIVVFHAEGAGIIERPVAHHAHHGNAQSRTDGQRFHGVHPAHAARTAEHARSANRRVLHDFEL